MSNTLCAELDNKPLLALKSEIRVSGIITGVKSKFTKTGKPFGIVTIEDYESAGELALFGEDWGRWSGMLTIGCSVFITAKCVQPYQNGNYYDFKVQNIQFLQDVKEHRLEKITITINRNAIDDTLVNDLNTIISENPGKTQLYLQIIDEEHNTRLLLRSKNKEIDIKNNLISYIEANPAMQYSIN